MLQQREIQLNNLELKQEPMKTIAPLTNQQRVFPLVD